MIIINKDKIAERMQLKGLSIKDLTAFMNGYPVSYVTNVLNGKNASVSDNFATQLAELLDLPVEDLILEGRRENGMIPTNYEYVDHPSHYGGKDNPYECIKVIDAWGLNFDLGTAVRYICRAGEKPDNSRVQDLKKAIWYLQHEVDKMED